MQNTLELTQFPATKWKLPHPWLVRSGCSHRKFEVYKKTKLSLFQSWLHLFCHLILVFHQAYFSPCSPLRSLNSLDLLPPFTLGFGGFSLCCISWTEQPLETLDWVTATPLFQGHLVAPNELLCADALHLLMGKTPFCLRILIHYPCYLWLFTYGNA